MRNDIPHSPLATKGKCHVCRKKDFLHPVPPDAWICYTCALRREIETLKSGDHPMFRCEERV